MGNPLSSALADKDFLAAPAADQKGYLSSIDKDFAKASSADQDAYLKHILPAPTTNVGGKTVDLRTGAGGTEAAASQAVKPATTMQYQQPKPGEAGKMADARLDTPEGHQLIRQNVRTVAKNLPVVVGAAVAPELLPEMGGLTGLGLRGLASGIGAGVGTAAGQGITGQNPLSRVGLKEVGNNALRYGAGELALGGLSKIGEAIPSAARAGSNFQKVSAAAGSIPIDVNAPGEQAFQIQKLAESGGSMPKVVRDFLRRATDPDKPAMTYDEAHNFYSNASKLSADEMGRLSGPMKRAVGQFTGMLRSSLEGAAEQGGKLPEFQGAMKEYRNAAVMNNHLEKLKDYSIKGGLGLAGGEVLKKIFGY